MSSISSYAYSLLNVKALAESSDEWVIDGIASTPSPDRDGDIVEPLGAKYALPMPLLWQHDSTKAVGRVEFAKPSAKGIPYRAVLPKVSEAGALKDRIDEAVQSIKYRLVAAVSIGFRGLDGGVERLKSGGVHYRVWEWLELSLVTIPAQADATINSIKSADHRSLAAKRLRRDGVPLIVRTSGASGTKDAHRGAVQLIPKARS